MHKWPQKPLGQIRLFWRKRMKASGMGDWVQAENSSVLEVMCCPDHSKVPESDPWGDRGLDCSLLKLRKHEAEYLLCCYRETPSAQLMAGHEGQEGNRQEGLQNQDGCLAARGMWQVKMRRGNGTMASSTSERRVLEERFWDVVDETHCNEKGVLLRVLHSDASFLFILSWWRTMD